MPNPALALQVARAKVDRQRLIRAEELGSDMSAFASISEDAQSENRNSCAKPSRRPSFSSEASTSYLIDSDTSMSESASSAGSTLSELPPLDDVAEVEVAQGIEFCVIGRKGLLFSAERDWSPAQWTLDADDCTDPML